MSRVEAIVLDRDLHRVLMDLGRWGQAQLIRTSPGSDTAPIAPRDNREQIERRQGLIERSGRLRSQLGIGADPGAEAADQPLEELESDLKEWEVQVSRLLSDRERINARRDVLAADAANALPCLEAGIGSDAMASSEYLHFALGSMPAENGQALERPGTEDFVVVPLGTGDGKLRIPRGVQPPPAPQSSTRRSAAPDSRAIILQPPAPSASTHGRRRTSSNAALWTRRLMPSGCASRNCPRVARRRSLPSKPRAQLDRSLLDAESAFCRTSSTTLILAWVPESGLPELEGLLRDATQGRFLLSRSEAGASGDDVPVMLRHSPWVRPYAMLVQAYGTPLYTEIEPTVFMAVSYVIMFGIMFGDVGHGALLFASGLAARWLARAS